LGVIHMDNLPERSEITLRPIKGETSEAIVRKQPSIIHKTYQVTSYVKNFGGFLILIGFTIACFYIVVSATAVAQHPFYGSAEKMLFSILGAVVGFLFSQDRKPPSKEEEEE
jgi:hypothetical protein